ncbi:MAG: hypothetical protein M3521_11490 [Acidobacteriota bacterium]|jgi:hypothetical protein|nr:hypothetical protein [Acidobacteriota bacterium]MDQ3374495.1 hypothetical protein [Acidobacteriota bacterium]
MLFKKKLLIALALLLLIFSFSASAANANGGEYKKIVSHLKTKYRAKKVKIPFMFLARFAVSVVRPAGMKSFSVTLFEDLKFSRETLNQEMQTAMKNSFTADWSPILRVRSRTGEQVYMYMREAGNSVKITVVTIDKAQAAVIRATFNPEKLADFINNPKIFGISLDNKEKQTKNKISEPKENGAPENKIEDPIKDD